MYIVKAELPKIHSFRYGFFPREVRYKKQAEELKREVEKQGGKATIKRKARE